MTIIQTVNEYDFRHAFERMGRGKQFSYDGLDTLYEIVEEYADGAGEPFELDVVALCCDFAEYTLEEVLSEYEDCKEAIEEDGTVDMDDPAEVAEAVENWLNDLTLVRRFTRKEPETGAIVESFIIQAF